MNDQPRNDFQLLRPDEWEWPIQDPDVETQMRACFSSGDWGRYHGAYLAELQTQIGAMCQQPLVWPCSSGTIAVELGLRGLGVKPGDEVILAGYDFAGNFRAVESIGALPVLVDLLPDRWVLDLAEVKKAVSDQTRAILVSHLHGDLAEMGRLRQFADDQQIPILEDACQSPGARVDGQAVGSWGDAATFSFGGSKLLTAGRGGAVVTSSEQVLQRIRIFVERGNDAFPLSEIQAACLLPQIEKLDERNRLRAERVRQLQELIRDWHWIQTTPFFLGDQIAAYYKLAFLVEVDQQASVAKDNRNRIRTKLQSYGVPIDDAFRSFVNRSARRCRRIGMLPHSKQAGENTLVLHHPILLAGDDVFQRLKLAFERVNEEVEAASSKNG